MGFRERTKNGLNVLIIALLIVQLSGCGYILYPERRGQSSGRIDPGVAILDGVGLLVFFIPGLIAFAVDFASGAIYLPGGRHHRSSLSGEGEKVRMVRFNPRQTSGEGIQKIVEKETGIPIGMALNRMEIHPLKRAEDIRPLLAQLVQCDFRVDSIEFSSYLEGRG